MQRPRVQSVMETHHIKQSLGKNEDHQLRPHLSLTHIDTVFLAVSRPILSWFASFFHFLFKSLIPSPEQHVCPHSQNEQILKTQHFWQLLIYSLY